MAQVKKYCHKIVMIGPTRRTPYTILDGIFDAGTVALAVGICALQRSIVTWPDDLPTFAGPYAQTMIKTLAFIDAAYFVCRGVPLSCSLLLAMAGPVPETKQAISGSIIQMTLCALNLKLQ